MGHVEGEGRQELGADVRLHGDVTIKAEVTVARDDVAYMLIDALEGGSNYWYVIDLSKSKCIDGLCISEAPFHGGYLSIDDSNNDEQEASIKPVIVDEGRCIAGLQLMADRYPRHFADFIAGNGDADTADVFLQCVVLGEVVYG